MTEEELQKWWTHLTVEKKEEVMNEAYPYCTAAWNDATFEEKSMLFVACGGLHAHQHHEWKKGNTSYT